MPRLVRPIALLILFSLAVSGCALPSGAGRETQVLAGADSPEATFAVHPVTRETLPKLKTWPVSGPSSGVGWISRSRGPTGQIIEAGDKVNITVWDNEESSLLTNPGQKVVTLNNMTVSSRGTVFLPYVSEVYIAKMSPDQAREAIQKKMAELMPSSQVQLSHEPGRESSVDLISGVAKPGTFPLVDREITVLNLLAQGGGVPEGMENPQIRLMRDGTLYGVSMKRLLKEPSLDTTLRGGDKVYVEPDQRYFLSLGAAGREAQTRFPSETVTALDAMSLIGGLQEGRANPKGILVLRTYKPDAVRSDGRGPEKARVIFAIDLTTADGLFSAGEFAIQNQDLVLVTESPVTATQTVFGIISNVLSIGRTASTL